MFLSIIRPKIFFKSKKIFYKNKFFTFIYQYNNIKFGLFVNIKKIHGKKKSIVKRHYLHRKIKIILLYSFIYIINNYKINCLIILINYSFFKYNKKKQSEIILKELTIFISNNFFFNKK